MGQRCRYLMLAIAATLVVAAMATIGRSAFHTEANAGTSAAELRVTAGSSDCTATTANPAKCTVPLSTQFTVQVRATNFPTGGYNGMQAEIGYCGAVVPPKADQCTASTLTYVPQAASAEVVWVDKQGLNTRSPPVPTGTEGTIILGDTSTNFGGTQSTAKGALVQINLKCPASSTTQPVTLMPYDANLDTLGSNLNGPTGAEPLSDTLTINCGTGGGAPTPTNTVAAAATPTNTPPGAPTPTETPAGGPTPTNTPPGGPTATNTPPGAPTATNTAQPPTPTRTNTPRPPTATSTPASLLGDVNCDHSVTSVDAALVLQFDTHLITMLACMSNADVNHDGHVNSIDSLYILWIVAGLYHP